MAVKFMNGQEAEAAIGKGKQFLVFYAEWCGPCQMLHPILEELSDKVEIIKVDTDKNKDFAIKNEVRGIPTIKIFDNGKLTETLTGFVPKEVLEQKL